MITIISSSVLLDALPPLDEETVSNLRLARNCARLEKQFNTFAVWLGILALLYVFISIYNS